MKKMRTTMLFLVIFAMILMVACNDEPEYEQPIGMIDELPGGLFSEFVVKVDLQNPDKSEDFFYVFFMPVGSRNTDMEMGTSSGYYGPFKTDANGEVAVSTWFNWELTPMIERSGGQWEIFVTTPEDYFVRNPLNKQTLLEFVSVDPEQAPQGLSYATTVTEINVPIVNQYPDGVLSLPFPHAHFVIKLEFPKGAEPDDYEVDIVFDEESLDVNDSRNIGSVARGFYYWDVAFFPEDDLANKSGTIRVSEFSPGNEVFYKDYPKRVSFDGSGYHNGESVIKIQMP